MRDPAVLTVTQGSTMRTLHERTVHAYSEAARLLANANEAREKGQTKRAARLYDAAQKALDKYNRLAGRG